MPVTSNRTTREVMTDCRARREARMTNPSLSGQKRGVCDAYPPDPSIVFQATTGVSKKCTIAQVIWDYAKH